MTGLKCGMKDSVKMDMLMAIFQIFIWRNNEKIEGWQNLIWSEGEGRNAVFAAKLGWKTHAFDISIEGKKKQRLLLQKTMCQLIIK